MICFLNLAWRTRIFSKKFIRNYYSRDQNEARTVNREWRSSRRTCYVHRWRTAYISNLRELRSVHQLLESVPLYQPAQYSVCNAAILQV